MNVTTSLLFGLDGCGVSLASVGDPSGWPVLV